MYRYLFLLLSLTLQAPRTVSADCLGCITPHTEHFENGVKQHSYVKKCLAKQKDLDTEYCGWCKCPRSAHSVHRHPYKWHNGKKLVEHPADLALKSSGNQNPQPARSITELVSSLQNIISK